MAIPRPVPTKIDIVDVVIPSGGSLSPAVNLGGRILIGVTLPETWTAAAVTFEGATSTDSAATFKDVYDGSTGTLTEVSTGSASGGEMIAMRGDQFGSALQIKVRSGTSGTPVNQAADRTVQLALADFTTKG